MNRSNHKQGSKDSLLPAIQYILMEFSAPVRLESDGFQQFQQFKTHSPATAAAPVQHLVYQFFDNFPVWIFDNFPVSQSG